MPPPRLDENGLRFGDEDAGISISELAILLWSTEIDMKCVDCSSSGMSKVSQVLADYKEIGTVNKIKERLVGVAVELLKSPWLQAQIDTMLVDAPRQCPFHPSYDADFVPATIDVSGDASPVSRDTVELIAFAGAAAVGVVGVAGAESHLAFDPEPTDPMSAESALLVPEGTNLLSFGDFDGYVDMALDDLRAALGSNVEDSTGPNANSTGEDLLINVLLRNELLDEDRALEIPVNKSLQEAGFMVGLESVRIFGLDTFSSFDVLDIIGNYTFTNTFTLDNVAVELDVVLDMSPPEESQDRRSLESGTLEHMLFRLSMREIDVTAAVFLAIDEDRLFDLPLGSILRANQVVGCLLSSTFGAEVTDLSATMGDIHEPTFTGFVSDELNTEISEAMEMIRQKYRSMMLDSVPALFGVTLRKILNNIADSYLSEDTSKYCPPPVVPPEAPGVVDFRDLILSPTEAAAAGGGGDSPYGDLAAKLINIIDERLLSSLSEDGTPKINEAVIRPFTLEQSGTEGQFNFEDDLANFASQVDFAGIGGIDFRASNATISNLDTFGHPLELLRPDTTFPYVLDNKANMGVGPEPLSGSLRVLMEVTGDPKLSMSNELLLGMNVRSANIFASILAKMSEKDFLHFPIGDVMLPQCWLASILTPVLDSVGLRDGTLEPSLALEEFALAIASLRFNVSCVACSTEGLVELPGIIGVLEEAGTVSEWTSRLVDFIVDILQSNLVTVQIDRVLADAPKQCPHSPEYDESFLPTEYDAIGSFDLSRDSVEFVVYSGLVVFESIAVVVAKTHTSYETQVQDPLSGQKLLEAPTDVRLLDLEDLGASVGSWADSILDEASGFFAGRVEDANSPSGEDLAVNVFLRDWLLDKEGVLVLDIDDLGIEAGGFTVSFQSVRILGLDTFTSFDALQVIGSQTLLNNFSMKKLGVEVSVAIDMEPDSPGDAEVMTFGVTMTDIEATIAFLVALDLDRLGSLPLGSILRIEQILPCVLSSMHAVNLTQFSVSVGDISEPDIHGFISPDTKNAIEEVSRAIFGTYKSDLIEGVPNFFDVTVRALLNNLLHEYMDKESSVSCPSLLSSGESTVLDMRDLFLPESDAFDLGAAGNSPYGDLFRSLKSLVDEEVLAVDPVTGLSKANDMVIGPLTKKQSNVTGMLHYQNDLIGGKKRLVVGGFKADAEFRLSNIRIEHLDTVGNPLELLQPIQSNPHVLNNTAAVGVANEPLRLTMSVLFSLQADDGTRMHNELDLGVDLETAMVVLGALIKISEGSFFSFPLRDLTNFNCWLATIDAPALDSYGVRVSGADPTLALQHLSASIQRLQLRVDCIDCSSPALRDISELLSSPQAIKDATDTANRVLDYGTGLLGGKFLQIKIDRMLRDAVAKCPHKEGFDSDFDGYTYQAFESPQMEESSLSFFIAMAIVAVVIFILAAIAYFVVKWVVWRRHRRWLKTKTEEEIFHIHMSQMQEENQEKELCRRTSSMCSSKVIPLALRVLMPLIILGNIAFFLSGHLSKGASVSIRLHLGGQDLIIEDFFVFSIARSTVDMWKAGAKELAMLILIFSGIWPYTKQLVTLVLWFMPPSRVSVSKRGSIFLWLDILGKWSMIDIFVLLVCLAAFRVSISSPELGFLPEGLYSLDLTVIPLWGLYANMTAQLISQVSSHFIIYYHRKIVDTAAEERDGSMSRSIEDIKDCDASSETSKGEEYASFAHEEEPSEHKEALFRHRFVLTYNKEGRHAIVRRWVNHVPPAVAIVILALIIWGCTWTSFSLEVHGLVGLAVESGQGFQQAKRQYNLFSLAKALMDQARFLDVGKWYLGLGILASLLVITVLIVPLFQVAVLLWIWFAKLTDRKRKFAMATVEVLQAWQYVEVYILSIIVGAWQIGGVSGFMVNEYCDALEEMFAEYAYYGIISESDAQCFRVDATLEGACFVLLVAAILLGFLNNFIMKALNQHIHDLDSAGKIEVLSIKEGTTFANEDVGTSSRAAKIKPLSPRFTDSYRWFTVVDKPFEPFCSNPSKLNLDVTPDAIRDTTRELSDPSRDSCIDVENGSFESSVTEGAVSVTA
uniref:Uncharacterized protein n=1 Tax=Pseudictyota dubia TaxID=2749911 RepID=A0A7R9WEW7_9STRA